MVESRGRTNLWFFFFCIYFLAYLFETGSFYVGQAGLKLWILLTQQLCLARVSSYMVFKFHSVTEIKCSDRKQLQGGKCF